MTGRKIAAVKPHIRRVPKKGTKKAVKKAVVTRKPLPRKATAVKGRAAPRLVAPPSPQGQARMAAIAQLQQQYPQS